MSDFESFPGRNLNYYITSTHRDSFESEFQPTQFKALQTGQKRISQSGWQQVALFFRSKVRNQLTGRMRDTSDYTSLQTED